MRLLISILVVFLTLSCSESSPDQEWKLVWADEFDYSGLPSSSDWSYEKGFIRNNELQYYTRNRLENAVVGDGNLMIIGRKEQYETAEYTSASLITFGKHTWKYGRIEASIKLPKGQGLWPAFWTLGENIYSSGWPYCGEIDILEHINNEDKIYGTAHWDKNGHSSSGGSVFCDVTDYHTYSIEWDREEIKWYLDGNQYWSVGINDNLGNTNEFTTPQYIILNLAIGGSWPGNPDQTTMFPDTMFVDYVRVYQLGDK